MAASRMSAAFLFMCVLFTAPANAESIVFSTLGPGDAFDGTAASFFGFDDGQEGDPDHRFARGMPFTPSSTATLRSLDLALDFTSDFSPGLLVINLFAASGDLPGALLETWTRSGSLEAGVHAFGSAARPLLLFGRTYFVEATTTERGFGGWYFSSVEAAEGARGADVYRNDNGPWQRSAAAESILALRVTGDVAPVPEPASLILVGTALALVSRRRRLSKQGGPAASGINPQAVRTPDAARTGL